MAIEPKVKGRISMSEAEKAPEAAAEPARSTVGRVLDFVSDHPKTSMVLGAGVSVFAGAELLAAALVGGAITLAFGRSRPPTK
jgi:ElaB/YqjD/DUF883 family membrane-anchored ribosome-binding protein